MDEGRIKQIVEAALLASDGPLTVANLVALFAPGELSEDAASRDVREALQAIEEDSVERGVELKRVASGYRFQVRQELSVWVSRLWDAKPPRYSRALLETLALVAYKQPVTRGDIEQVRGVSVSQNIMRTLLEREWIKVVGHKEVPGKPALYATTKEFLDYFNLKSLGDLPPLPEIRGLIEPVLETEATSTDATSEIASGVASDMAGQTDAEVNRALGPDSPTSTQHVDNPDTNDEGVVEGITVEPVSLSAEVVPLHPESAPKST